jgi:hypothetical protein
MWNRKENKEANNIFWLTQPYTAQASSFALLNLDYNLKFTSGIKEV